MKAILNSKKVLFAVLAAVLFSACLVSLPTEAEACYSCKPCYYTVIYCPNGGTPNTAYSEQYYYYNTYTIRQNTMYNKTGYTFNGWNSRSDGKGTSYPPGSRIACGSVTLYAQWKQIAKITATYYPNGGTGATIVESVTPGTNYKIRANSFTRAGYTFDGWYLNAAGTGTKYSPGQVVCLTGSVSFYAKWKANQCNVTYYPNGGVGSNIVVGVNYGSQHTVRSNTFTRTGYTFDGWYTNTAGTGTKYSPGQVFLVCGNVNLYAKWTAAPYKITYNPNGGSGSVITDSVAYGVRYTVRPATTYTRTNYTFSGWNTNSAGTGTNYTAGQVITVSGNLTLYAKWTACPVQYKITYYPNGGTGSNIIDTATAGATYTVRSNTFTRSGYTFAGWSTNTAGTGTVYTAGQRITVTANLNLYAKWTQTTVKNTITYNPNGGTGSIITDTANQGTSYTIRPASTYTRTGYTLVWNTNAAGTGTTYTPGQVITVNGSLNLYPKWIQTTIRTITYYPNGGTPNTNYSYTVISGGSHTIINNPYTRAGFIFDGWYANTAGTGTKYTPGQIITVNNDLPLYPKWVPSSTPTCTITYKPNGGIPNSNVVVTVPRGSRHTILPGTTFTRPGREFLYWSTSTSNGTRYYPGNVITVNNDLTLNAIWTPGM